MARTTYQVTYERDGEGYWVAEIPRVAGCYAQGRSLAAAKRKIREVLLYLRGASFLRKANLEDTFKLEKDLNEKLDGVSEEAERLRVLTRALERDRLRLIQRLARLNYSVRDVGEMLGISHQRVAQLMSRESR